MHDIALFGEVLADCFPDQTVLGGAPYNVTRHLHGFQQHPLLISKAGNDALKEQLLFELKRLGISQAGIQTDAAYPTGKVIVHIENKTHHFNIRPNQAYDYIDAEDAIKAITSINPSIIYFGTLIQRGKVSSAALSRILSDNITPCFLDINLRAPWYNKQIIETALHSANFVKVSEEELTTIARLFEPQAMSLKEVAFFLIKNSI